MVAWAPLGKEEQRKGRKGLPSDAFEFKDHGRRYRVSEPLFDVVVRTGDNPLPPRYYLVTRFDDGVQVRVDGDRYVTQVMTQDEIKDKALQLFKDLDA